MGSLSLATSVSTHSRDFYAHKTMYLLVLCVDSEAKGNSYQVANPTYGIYMNFRSFQVEARSSGLLAPHLACPASRKEGEESAFFSCCCKKTEFGGFKQERRDLLKVASEER